MTWVERLAGSDLSPQSQRHLLGLLSRFFSWCIERGLATTNPVRMVPVGRRPVPTLDPDRPWLEDETKVSELMAALGPEVGLMFYLGNRSGLRPGEVCGLRMSDLEFLHEGVIRVARLNRRFPLPFGLHSRRLDRRSTSHDQSNRLSIQQRS